MIKIANSLPKPPVITLEIKEKILQEAKEFRKEIAGKIRNLERLTVEDWCVKVR